MLFFASGSYTVAMSGSYLGVSPWLSIPLGATVAAAAALVIGIACLRLAPAYVAPLTFAIGFMILTLIISELGVLHHHWRQLPYVLGCGTNGFSQFPDFGFRQWLKGGWLLGNYFTVLVAFTISLVGSILVIHGRLGFGVPGDER